MADSTVKYLNKLTWLRAETKKKLVVESTAGWMNGAVPKTLTGIHTSCHLNELRSVDHV